MLSTITALKVSGLVLNAATAICYLLLGSCQPNPSCQCFFQRRRDRNPGHNSHESPSYRLATDHAKDQARTLSSSRKMDLTLCVSQTVFLVRHGVDAVLLPNLAYRNVSQRSVRWRGIESCHGPVWRDRLLIWKQCDGKQHQCDYKDHSASATQHKCLCSAPV